MTAYGYSEAVSNHLKTYFSEHESRRVTSSAGGAIICPIISKAKCV